MLLRSNFSSFPHYYIYIFLTLGVKLHIHLLIVVVQFIILLSLNSDMSRYGYLSRSVSVSPFEFDITRVDCNLFGMLSINTIIFYVYTSCHTCSRTFQADVMLSILINSKQTDHTVSTGRWTCIFEDWVYPSKPFSHDAGQTQMGHTMET